MSDHILVANAARKRYRTRPEMPERAVYDLFAGCWFLDGVPLVTAEGTKLGPPMSKKFDIETGEDRKGE